LAPGTARRHEGQKIIIQVRLLFDNMVGTSGPRFSGWNPSLRSAIVDILTFDEEKLLKAITDQSTPFSDHGRLFAGLVFKTFFGEDSLLQGDFFRTSVKKICLNLKEADHIVKLLLYCPSTSADFASDVLSQLEVSPSNLEPH